MKYIRSLKLGFETGHWLKSDFLRKVFALSVNRSLVMGLGFLISIVLVRELGPEGRGLYVAALSVALIGVQFGNLGFQVSHTLMVSRNKSTLAALTANSLLIGLLIGGMEAAVMAAVFILFPSLAPIHGRLLGMSLAWIPFGIIYFLFYNLFVGIDDIKSYVKIELTSKAIQLLLIYLLAYFFDFRVEVFFACAFLLQAVSCAWQFLKLRKHFQEPFSPSLDLYKGQLFQGLRAYLVGVLSFLLIRIDMLIVKYILGSEQTGYYSVSASLADIIPLIPSMIAIMLFPRLSSLADTEERWRLARKALRSTSLFLLPILALVFFLAKPVIGFVYGAPFLPAVRSFQLLVPGVYFLAIQMMAVQFLKSEGFPLRAVINWLAIVSLNISLDIWLVPRYGIEGAAAVSSICYFLIFVLNVKLVWKIMSVRPSK